MAHTLGESRPVRFSSFTILLTVLVLGTLLNCAAAGPDPVALRQACSRNLQLLSVALKAYETDTGALPEWLSDLVPKYVSDIRKLICPQARYTGQSEESVLADPRLPCSYIYTLAPRPDKDGLANQAQEARHASHTTNQVPLLRCRQHDPVLNVSAEGKLFDSPPTSERRETNPVSSAPENITTIIPPRAKDAPATAIDLTAFYNASLSESWHAGPGNDLAMLEAGLTRLDGVTYDVRGVVQLSANRAELNRYPKAVEAIHVDRHCRKIHFLHSAIFGGPAEEGKRVGTYVVRFASTAMTLEIPLVYGRDLRDWHYAPHETPSNPCLKVAWVGENEVSRRTGRPLRLFTTAWTNLLPDLKIASLDFVSEPGECAPFLLAVTVE